MTPKQVLQMIKDKGVVMVDIKFIDLLGQWQHFQHADQRIQGRSAVRRGTRLRRLVDPRLAVDRQQRHAGDPRSRHRGDGSLHQGARRSRMICNISDPITRADYSRDPRNIARKAEAYLKSTGIGDTAYFGPEPEFFIFDGIRYDTNQHSSYYYIESDEGVWNSGTRGRQPRLQAALQGRLLPGAADRHACRTSAPRWCCEMERVGIRVEKQHHEVATAGQAEIDMRFQSLVKMARLADLVQVHLQERRDAPRQDRDLHAQADLRRQRLRHAYPSEHLEGRDAAVRGLRATPGCRRWRCTTSPASCITRRRSRPSPIRAPTRIAAWCRASRRRSTWPTRSRNRSAVGAYPDVLAVAQGQADRGALPRPDLQSVPRVLGDADGGARRHPAPARSGPAARQGHLRADSGRAGGGAEHAGVARGRARQPEEATTSSCSRATSSPRT